MSKLSILEWNINGRSNISGNYEMPNHVIDTLICKSPDVFILTEFIPDALTDEVKSKFEQTYNLKWSDNYKQYYSNAVLIGVKRELNPKNFNFELKGYKSIHPNFGVVELTFNNKNIAIIGFRMLSFPVKRKYNKKTIKGFTAWVEELRCNYNIEKCLFDIFIKNNLESMIAKYDSIIFTGDFNNAMHYGDKKSSFNEVKKCYDKHQIIEGRRIDYKVGQYNYNLHIIQDELKKYNLFLLEGNNDWSWLDKNGNQIHNDHFFVTSDIAEKYKGSVEFENVQNGFKEGLDHRYLIGTIDFDQIDGTANNVENEKF